MNIKLKAMVLCALVAAAAVSGSAAVKTLKPAAKTKLPAEIYARYKVMEDGAKFFLRPEGEYIAVYQDKRGKNPLMVTGIELSCLRDADKAMVEAGLPARDRRELLMLLEDLGS